MSKKLFTFVLAVLLLMGQNVASANMNNMRRASNQPRSSAMLSMQSSAPDWAPKLISATPDFASITSGVSMLKHNPLAAPQFIVSPSGATIQGLRAQSTDPNFQKGWYELTTDGGENLMWTSEALAETIGFVRGSELYTFFSLDFMGQIFVSCNVYDLNTGEFLRSKDLNTTNYSQMVLSAVYDEQEDVAYVYTYNENMTDALIQRVDLETFEFTLIRSDENLLLDRVVAWAYNPVDHEIYGVSLSGHFVRMDKESGLFFYVGMTGITPGSYSQSMVYSPLDHKFVWACILPDQTSCLFTIDPITGVAQSVYRYEYPNQYTILYTPDKVCVDNAPGLATFKSLQFEGASTTGKGVVTLPTVNYVGEPISGEVYLRISDGRTVIHSELKGQVGEDVEFELTLTEGLHDVSAIPFFKENGSTVDGHPVYKKIYVGYDTPKKPENVVLTETSVSWNAVGAVGANGGFVDVNDLKYNVYLNGVKQNEEPVVGTNFALTIPDSTLAYYTVEVEAVAGGKVSEKASTTELFGHAFPVPYSATPTEEQIKLFTMVNSGYGFWKFNSNESEPLYHLSDKDEPANNWLFLPLIAFTDEEHLYEVSFDARCRLADFGNVLQVGISKTTNPEDAEIFYTQSLNNTEYLTFKKMFNVEAAGDYYIAIKCASETDGFYLYLKNIEIRLTDNLPDVPGLCENFKLIPAEKGELKATVEFTMPRKSLVGGSLYTKGGELTATIKSDVETLTVSGTPGSRQSVDIATVQGMSAVYVYVSNSYGDGEEVRGMVFCGEDAPTFTNINVDASEDNLTAIVSWNAPKKGANGGYLNPDNLVYTIYNNHPMTGEWIELGKVTGETEYRFTLPSGAGLQLLTLGLTVSNQYGGGENVAYSTIVLGPPHKLPMIETFDGVIAYEPIVEQPLGDDYTGQWIFANPTEVDVEAENNSGYALIGFPATNANAYGRIALPKFSTSGAERAELKMRFFVADYTPETEILICGNSDDEVVLGTVSSQDGEGWITKTFVFPEEFQNRKWAYIALRAKYDGQVSFIIMDSYSIKDPLAQDLAITSLEGPKATMIGNTEYYNVTIENNGYETMAVPEIVCQLVGEDGKVLKNLDATSSVNTADLDPSQQLDLQFEYKPTVDNVGNLKIRASFDTDDMDLSNNAMEQAVVVQVGTDPIVTDLEASYKQGGNSVELNWSAPVVSLGLEDFEGMIPFSYDENLGDWTNIDGDGLTTWVFGSWTYPDCGLAKGFQVFDYTQLPVSDALFKAYSGDKYLVAISPDDPNVNADDWLISPQIKGGSSVSFQFAIINQQYSPEYVEVMYSSTTKDRSAFKVVETFSKSTLGWELITTKLPADAKYFAIHYVSKNTFGIMIDDITYAPADQLADDMKYNVYRDGQKIAEKLTATSYVDSNVEVKNYVYNVTVVVNKEGSDVEYSMSNSAYANLLSSLEEIALDGTIYASDGCIVLSGYAEQDYGVYTIDGICVASGIVKSSTERIKLAPDVYVLKVGTRVEKIIVK